MTTKDIVGYSIVVVFTILIALSILGSVYILNGEKGDWLLIDRATGIHWGFKDARLHQQSTGPIKITDSKGNEVFFIGNLIYGHPEEVRALLFTKDYRNRKEPDK